MGEIKVKDFLSKVDKVILGGVTVVIVFFLGFLWWVFTPQDSVPMWALSVVIILWYASCIIVYAVSSKNIEIMYVLPKIKSISVIQDRIIFLLEKNDLFVQGAYVTIAYEDESDSIEIILGIGYVETINSQGNIQVTLAKKVDNSQVQDILSQLSTQPNKKYFRDAIKIKPTVQRRLLEEDII